MNAISIISSPFQLFSLSELIKQKGIKNYVLFVLVYNDYELLQIKNLALNLDLKIYKTIIGKKVFQYFLLRKLTRKFNNIDTLIIGNFFSEPHLVFVNEIKSNKIIILDDGLNSNLILKTSNKKNYSFFKFLFIKLFGFNLDFPKSFSIFTMFDLNSSNQNVIIEKNHWYSINKNIQSFNIKNITFVIGQPFVELKILDEVFYFSLIDKLNKRFSNLLYVPSRKENDRNLNRMNKKHGINILRTNMNVEHYLLHNKVIPKLVLGFTSTALVTLNKLFNQEKEYIDIRSIRISKAITENNKPNFGINYSFETYYKLLDDFKIKSLKNV